MEKQFFKSGQGIPGTIQNMFALVPPTSLVKNFYGYRAQIIKKNPQFKHGGFHKAGPGNTVRRFHGTKLACSLTNGQLCANAGCAVCSILRTGFLLQYANTGLFGRGMYFSSMSTKSNGYVVANGNGVKPMFVVQVVAGDTETVSGTNSGLTQPPNNKDSVVGQTNADELIVYADNTALPQYLILYK